MHHALDVAQAPVIFSRSSASALCDSPRNMPDDVLARLAGNGRVCMVTSVALFAELLSRGWTESDCAALVGGNIMRVMRAAESCAWVCAQSAKDVSEMPSACANSGRAGWPISFCHWFLHGEGIRSGGHGLFWGHVGRGKSCRAAVR
jgi:hypothetical protein